MSEPPDILNELYTYCESVTSGKIIACQKYRWACLRFMKDVDKIGTDGWKWIFDNYSANQYITRWVSLFFHSSGFLAGQPKIFNPYERFVYGNIYGWKNKDTGMRRFRRSYEQVARKNAKSQDKAIQALYELSAFGEQRAEIYIAATKKEQTRHVWAESVWLYQHGHPDIRDKFICKHDRDLKEVTIRHEPSGSYFARLSKDDKKSGDGSNPHFFILDEYHLHDTTEYYDLAVSGMKTRKQPLLSIITTAGTDINCPCYRIEYNYVKQLLDPESAVENERYFAVVSEIDKNESPDIIKKGNRRVEAGYPIDDITSFEAIQKSNPVLYNEPNSVELIKEEVKEAIDKPEIYTKVLTKTFNMWVNQKEAGYMNMVKWSLCANNDTALLHDILHSEVPKQPFIGLDLSLTTDLTSIVFVFSLPDGYYYIIHHSFMPENNVTVATERDKVPYRLWIDQGYITAIPGSNIEYHDVLNWLIEQYKLYNWKKGIACFDRSLAAWLQMELDKLKFVAISIPQSYTGLSLATKTLRAKVYDKKIIHQNDPVLNWAMSNCVIRMGPSENIMLDKAAARFRIDPVAALINAMNRAIATDNPVKKVGRVIFA
jgi:phage terminase large subunit-like protein